MLSSKFSAEKINQRNVDLEYDQTIVNSLFLSKRRFLFKKIRDEICSPKQFEYKNDFEKGEIIDQAREKMQKHVKSLEENIRKENPDWTQKQIAIEVNLLLSKEYKTYLEDKKIEQVRNEIKKDVIKELQEELTGKVKEKVKMNLSNVPAKDIESRVSKIYERSSHDDIKTQVDFEFETNWGEEPDRDLYSEPTSQLIERTQKNWNQPEHELNALSNELSGYDEAKVSLRPSFQQFGFWNLNIDLKKIDQSDAYSRYGSIPLRKVAQNKTISEKHAVKASEMLLNKGARNGFLPVYEALEQKKYMLAEYLIANSKGVDELRFSDNQTLLSQFVREGHKEQVQFLLSIGANPNSIDCRGMTALHHAAIIPDKAKSLEFIKLLADAGAMPNIRAVSKYVEEYSRYDGTRRTTIIPDKSQFSSMKPADFAGHARNMETKYFLKTLEKKLEKDGIIIIGSAKEREI